MTLLSTELISVEKRKHLQKQNKKVFFEASNSMIKNIIKNLNVLVMTVECTLKQPLPNSTKMFLVF